MRSPTIDVEIFGATYHVRGDQGSSHLEDLAATVDRKMREVAGHIPSGDAAKIAILAALNLADELSQVRKRQEGERVEVQEKAAELVGKLDEAMRGED